ncbi:hypothetical protein B0I00_1650 [Novosphingobium kunmingense]|uniref:Chorismate lyase n=1 Tax=Novosphingobium kunmingense TaxID=1211806 RepID=A0A2N0HKD9_9SPHN|nr:hypothetical protein [Novosphingobium kunmingense]PKB19417.1 hypothetical protein B0I00_1650 [Novosphingobium kunmingense]
MNLAASAALLSACTTHDETVTALEAALAATPSATRALEQWCAARGIAEQPKVIARQIKGERAPDPSDLRDRLAVSAATALGYRNVELVCGDRVLSVAHNWYVRERLTEEMNAALESSEVPFGKVVGPLRFTRETIASRHGPEPTCPTDTILSQVALLRAETGEPLALVTECYTAAALARS